MGKILDEEKCDGNRVHASRGSRVAWRARRTSRSRAAGAPGEAPMRAGAAAIVSKRGENIEMAGSVAVPP
eukprot:2944369-Pyramimonas_sp.AAC.1